MSESIIQKRLVSRAAEISDRTYDRTYHAEIIDLMMEPNFPNSLRQHNWRNHVDNEVKEIWNSLSISARLSIFINAEIGASKEEWD